MDAAINQAQANDLDPRPKSRKPATVTGKKSRMNSSELNSMTDHTLLRAFSGLYRLHDRANCFEGFDISHSEFDAEFSLYSSNEIDVIQRIPAGNIPPRRSCCKHDGLIAQ